MFIQQLLAFLLLSVALVQGAALPPALNKKSDLSSPNALQATRVKRNQYIYGQKRTRRGTAEIGSMSGLNLPGLPLDSPEQIAALEDDAEKSIQEGEQIISTLLDGGDLQVIENLLGGGSAGSTK